MKHNPCKKCQFWQRGHLNSGWCRRNPPYVNGFPATHENYWCGEFRMLPELEPCNQCLKPIGEDAVYIGPHIMIHKECEAEYYAKWPKYVGETNG